MELVVWYVFTLLWWMSSVSLLLPLVFLLKYSKSFQNRWFSWLFTRFVIPMVEPDLLPARKQVFQLLKSNLEERDKSIPLKVLEIGIGSGKNLQFYPENSHLTAVDMNSSFEPYLKKSMKKHPQLLHERTITCMAENMKELEDSCMDVVVSTYCLCSVVNVNSVLKEIKRVLKPGGKFLFLEHVAFPPAAEWNLTVQRLANPLWNIYFGGCQVNRNTAELIQKMKFLEVAFEKFYLPTWLFFVRPQIMGIATK